MVENVLQLHIFIEHIFVNSWLVLMKLSQHILEESGFFRHIVFTC